MKVALIRYLLRLLGEQLPEPDVLEDFRAERELQIDTSSRTWCEIESWAKSEFIRARRKNDSTENTAEQTAAHRARIRMAKELLALPHRKQPQVEEHAPYTD